MCAAANGTMRVQDRNGRIRSINFYLSDAANVLAKFDESKPAVAGSPDNFLVKSPGTVVDVCLTTDVATPTAVQVLVNGVPTGDILDCTAQLCSVVVRPNPNVPVNAGDKVQLMQL